MFVIKTERTLHPGGPENPELMARFHGMHVIRGFQEAVALYKEIKRVKPEGVSVTMREATRDDFWDLAQTYAILVADFCAKKDRAKAMILATNCVAFLSLANGDELSPEEQDLIFKS